MGVPKKKTPDTLEWIESARRFGFRQAGCSGRPGPKSIRATRMSVDACSGPPIAGARAGIGLGSKVE